MEGSTSLLPSRRTSIACCARAIACFGCKCCRRRLWVAWLGARPAYGRGMSLSQSVGVGSKDARQGDVTHP